MNTDIKKDVTAYWNQASYDVKHAHKQKYSQPYFDDIEHYRYAIKPEIFSFAQFTRFHKKKVLEVGIGTGTDFIQWVKAGAYAYGTDLTQEAINNAQKRLQLENLTATDIRIANAEALPYDNNTFDCVYSWGVIHHFPDPKKCLQEIIRVTKPGGTIKIMIYNRHSLFAFYQWLHNTAKKRKLFKSISWALAHHQENSGTKAFTKKEIINWLKEEPVTLMSLKATITQYDLLYYKTSLYRGLAYLAAFAGGWHKRGWFMTIELMKVSN